MRALGLLLVLSGLAALAFALLRAHAGNCDRLEREATQSASVMQLCMQQLSCRFDYEDLRAVVVQVKAVQRCRAREE